MNPFVSARSLPKEFVFVASVFAIAIAGCKKAADETPQATVSVQAAHPTVGSISEEIAGDAILAPMAQAAIAPRISAPIKTELVQRGAHVRKGQLLLTLEDRDLQGSALDSRGAVQSAEASYTVAISATNPEDLKKAQQDVDQLKAARDVAARTADERKKLFQEGALSGRDADTAYAASVQAEAAYNTALKHLDVVQNTTQQTNKNAAQGQLTSAKGKEMNADAQVAFANIRSPIVGVVTDRPLFPGETAQAGTTVITVMDTSSLLAKLHLSQATTQKLAVGRKAEVKLAGIDGPLEATVSFISPALDAGSTTVEVWLKVPNPDGKLKVGTPVHAVITGRTIDEAIQVPATAIVPADDGSTNVVLVGTDGAAHKKAVKVGIRTPETVQILSGISAGDNVITEGGYGLDEGTKVTLGKPGTDEDKN